MSRIFNIFILVITIIISAGLIISAYSGHISPLEMKYAPLAMYTFPGWLALAVIILTVDLIWWRRTAMVVGLSMLVCSTQIHDFCPLNIPKGAMNEEEKAHSFTLMTYNVMNFSNQDKTNPIYTNEQLDYVLSESPDVVCIEEAMCLSPNESYNHISQEQLAELNEMYPYIYIEGESFALFSKIKAEPVPINFPKGDYVSGDIACWRLYFDEQVINLFVVHLRSFAFTYDERDIFEEMTTIESVNRQTIRDAKSDLLPKLTSSTPERIDQFEWLIKCLKKYGGENTIVCGDFNDPVGCYGLYQLDKESKLKQVYSEVGFGPMITYNANNFYFRIDHVLYRGDALKPYSIERGDIKASDHYPVTVRFTVRE